MFFKPL